MDIVYKHNTASEKEILRHLQDVDSLFAIDLSKRVNLEEYAKKLFTYAELEEAWHESQLVGLVAYYVNDECKESFISNVSVDKICQKQGIATELLNYARMNSIARSMQLLRLEVAKDNKVIISYYQKRGYILQAEQESSQCTTLVSYLYPIVAIRCTVYNHEPYLRQCLDGFVMQKTNFPFIAIVHDDASTDNSAAIIREYAEKYPDIIKPIYETENQYSKGINNFIKVMQSYTDATAAKYIALCEGDDYWTDPLKLQKQVDFMETHQDVGLCYTDFNCLLENNNNILKYAMFKNGFHRSIDFKDHLLTRGYIAPMTWLYKRDIYVKICPLNQSSDGSFAIALEFYHHSNIAFIDEVTATYRIHNGSASRPINHDKMWNYAMGVMLTQLEYARKYGDEELVKSVYLNNYLAYLLPLAIKFNKKDFIKEASDYMNGVGFNFEYYSYLLKESIINSKQYEQVCQSHAYQLGKFIIRPFSWIRRVLHGWISKWSNSCFAK